jgi:hypothetical protein
METKDSSEPKEQVNAASGRFYHEFDEAMTRTGSPLPSKTGDF